MVAANTCMCEKVGRRLGVFEMHAPYILTGTARPERNRAFSCVVFHAGLRSEYVTSLAHMLTGRFAVLFPENIGGDMSETEPRRHWLDYVGVWVALFAAVGSLLGAGASWYQFKASREQLQSMKFDQRPWVSLDMQSEGPLVRDENNGMAYTFAYSVNNVGHSPAFNVMFTATMIRLADPVERPAPASGYSYLEPTAALRGAVTQTCHENDVARAQGMGEVLFPNVVRNLRWKAHSPGPARGYVPGFAVVACVSYQFSGDPTVHKTVRVFDLLPQAYGKMIDLDVSGGDPIEVAFIQQPVEGFSAD